MTLAFPGAEGFGAETIGGRDGQIFEVTNLNDSGPGSFRAGIEAEGPRICVFDVSGTIELQSRLNVVNPFLSILGQTAPRGGIALTCSPAYRGNVLSVATHDVIARYIRVRTGPSDELSTSRGGMEIAYNSPYNVILDHCSVSWAVDENMTMYFDLNNITIQWCIISEGLHNSSHEKGPHSAGMMVGSNGARDISIHHNLFVHNNSRNVRIKTTGTVDFVNNVIYNFGQEAVAISDEWVKVPVNLIGNYCKRGFDSDPSVYFINLYEGSANGFDLYVQGNITPNRPTDDLPEDYCVEPGDRQHVVGVRNDAPLVTTTSAFEAYDQVLANAGATLPMRDAVDERIVNDVINDTGKIIDDPSEVGGWPDLSKEDEMSVITDMEAVEAQLRLQAQELIAQADKVAQAIIDLRAADDALDAAADVIEVD